MSLFTNIRGLRIFAAHTDFSTSSSVAYGMNGHQSGNAIIGNHVFAGRERGMQFDLGLRFEFLASLATDLNRPITIEIPTDNPDFQQSEVQTITTELNRCVKELRIMTHGSPGAVYADSTILPPLNLSRINRYSASLYLINRIMMAGGTVVFTGCNTGQGEEGHAFLRELSIRFPSIKWLAFTTMNYGSIYNHAQPPAEENFIAGEMTTEFRTANEYSPHAKLYLNGTCLRSPTYEINRSVQPPTAFQVDVGEAIIERPTPRR